MHTFLGMILGALLLVAGVYVYDSMQTSTVANGQVAVRFSPSHSVEVCRGMFIQIGVLVPPLPRWTAAFEAANARRSGFLMKDAPANPQTILNYQPR